MKPVDMAVSTPYGRRGPMWRACQFHTGDDFAVPAGTRLVAAIAGTIRHRNYGAAFGRHQFAISPSPGQPFADGEVFYAHTRTRLPDGTEVAMGDFVAESGAEGNVSGPHLHLEYHPHTKNRWACDVVADPQPIYQPQPATRTAPAPAPAPAPPAGDEGDEAMYPIIVRHPSGAAYILDSATWATPLGSDAAVQAYQAAGVPVVALPAGDFDAALRHRSVR